MTHYTFFQLNFINKFLGMSPRQVSSEYRKQETRTLIGFGIFHRDSNDIVKCLNVDLVSNNKGECGYDTVNAFR